MIESNLVSGKQDINKKPLIYGQSITDGCINLESTEIILDLLQKSKICRDLIIKEETN